MPDQSWTGGGSGAGAGAFLNKSAAKAPWQVTTPIAVAASRPNVNRRIIAGLPNVLLGQLVGQPPPWNCDKTSTDLRQSLSLVGNTPFENARL